MRLELLRQATESMRRVLSFAVISVHAAAHERCLACIFILTLTFQCCSATLSDQVRAEKYRLPRESAETGYFRLQKHGFDDVKSWPGHS